MFEGVKGALARSWGFGAEIVDPSKVQPGAPLDWSGANAYQADNTYAGGLGEYVEALDAAGIWLKDPGRPLRDYTTGYNVIDQLWATQPHLRAVVDFIASTIASTPLHLYRRDGDTDRTRITTGTLAGILTDPEAGDWPSSRYRFWWRVMLDKLLTDRFLLLIDPATGKLTRIPPARFRMWTDGAGRVSRIEVYPPNAVPGVTPLVVPPGRAILDFGYGAHGLLASGPVASLIGTLTEQADGSKFRSQLMAQQARISGAVTRPQGATWSETARNRFTSGLKRFVGQGGSDAGGVILLEDGMTYTPHTPPKLVDNADNKGRELSQVEVCAAFHVPPELIGYRAGTYANVAMYRAMLYGDALGPHYQALEDALAPLVPLFGESADEYIEFQVAAKLRGSFQEQAAVLQTAVGGPWMSRNEARAMNNLPSIGADGDALITPLNVTTGGQASPTDAGSQNVGVPNELRATPTPPAVKAAPATARAKARSFDARRGSTAAVLAKTLHRQGAAIVSHIGAAKAAGQPVAVKAPAGAPTRPPWWRPAWDDELAADLAGEIGDTAEESATGTLDALGSDAAWSRDGITKWTAAAASAWALAVNTGTVDAVLSALASAADNGTDPVDAVRSVFDPDAVDARAGDLAEGITTDAAGFGASDAAQVAAYDAGGQATKTWIVTASNPRESCAAVDGETVGIGETFSNGLSWPGDSSGSADETCGCTCDLEMSLEGSQ